MDPYKSTPSGSWLPSNKDSFHPHDAAGASGDSSRPQGEWPAGWQAAPASSPVPPIPPIPPVPPTAPVAPASHSTRRATFSVLMAAMLVAGGVGGAAGSAITAASLSRHTGVPLAAPAVTAAAPKAAQAAIADTGLRAIYKQVNPAVVSVQTSVAATQSSRRQGTPGLPNTPNAPGLLPSGEGTGFIVDGDGSILTNYHVVEGASRVTVVLADGTSVQAQVVGSDPSSDVALLKASIPAGKGAVVALGDSDAVEPGDPAIAIGTPFGFDHSITAGIVSGVDRDFGSANGRPMRGLIQTDAAINPGNSGGPLLNAAGEVIGITTSIESPVRANVGIGFAIPINQAKQLLPALKSGQKVEHAWLGISGAPVSTDSAADLGLPNSVTSGVAVLQVAPNSPAAQAGLRGGSGSNRAGDVIVAIDGKNLTRVQDVSSYLEGKKPGDTVTLTVIRDGARQDVKATLAPWPATDS